MNKNELVAAVSEKTGMTKVDAESAVVAVVDSVVAALVAGDKVAVAGLGTFTVKDRAARKGRNPQTGEEIEIAASRAVSFKASKSLKESV